jgi:hypothetical protein
MEKSIYYIEVTDTFGGETNYCWIRRYAVRASSERGAMRVIGNHEGFAMRNDGLLWHFDGACIAAYVVDYLTEGDDVSAYRPINF